jgi:peptide/nickel transport system substrate-binding protein
MSHFSKRELLKAGAAGLAVGELFFGLSPLATGSITALAQSPKRGGVVRAVVHPEPSSLMLGLVQNTPTQMVAGSIYESLLKYGHDLKPIPSLAERWEVSEDGKAYTFHLKRNVKWHDGKPFTADDVVFSTDVFLRELHPRWRPVATTHVERIEKLDDFTVRYQLKNPFGSS